MLPGIVAFATVPIECLIWNLCQFAERMFQLCVALQGFAGRHPLAGVFSLLVTAVTSCMYLAKKIGSSSPRNRKRMVVALRCPSGRKAIQCRFCNVRRVRQCRRRSVARLSLKKLCLTTLCLTLCCVSPAKAMQDCRPKHSVRHDKFWQARVGEASHPGPAGSRATLRRRRQRQAPNDSLQQVLMSLISALQPGQLQSLLNAIQAVLKPGDKPSKKMAPNPVARPDSKRDDATAPSNSETPAAKKGKGKGNGKHVTSVRPKPSAPANLHDNVPARQPAPIAEQKTFIPPWQLRAADWTSNAAVCNMTQFLDEVEKHGPTDDWSAVVCISDSYEEEELQAILLGYPALKLTIARPALRDDPLVAEVESGA